MQALIITAPGALSNPIAGTPKVPDLSRALLLEYDADKLTLADGADVTAWNSTDGSWGASANLPYASAVRPKFGRSALGNGHAAVKFSRASATLLKTHSAVALSPVARTPLTVMALVKFNAASDGFASTVFSGRTGDVGGYVYCRREISGRLSMGAGANQEILSQVVSPDLLMFVACVFDGANSKLYVDKVKTTGTTSGAFWDGVVVGANAVGTNNLDGDIAAMRAYTRALSDAEVLLQREAWLTARGLSV
ncbi:LamG-like jellyroll fold domain-containing protein [Pseudomonas putida]|uniref:LamG-like jellyroll fold domain-containing protein n=1 Tax=Pseudomonas putida TaxID=303 RepID=UPI002B24B5A5|nr:LamG-like jellyroll fold domain-containing protein [Pseudomonas putida]